MELLKNKLKHSPTPSPRPPPSLTVKTSSENEFEKLHREIDDLNQELNALAKIVIKKIIQIP